MGAALGSSPFPNIVTVQAGASNPTVAAFPDGGFIVAYEYQGDIFAQRYDNDLNKVGDVVQINTPDVTGTLSHPSLAILDDGSVVATYQKNVDGDVDIVFASPGVIEPLTLDLESGATVSGAGTLAIGEGQELDVAGVTLAMGALVNDGTLTAYLDNTDLDFATLSGTGMLQVGGDTSNAGTLTIHQDLTNAADHTIAFTALAGTASLIGDIVAENDAVLYNAGLITAETGNGALDLDIDIVNTGTMTLNDSATLFAGRQLDIVNGNLSVIAGQSVGVGGTVLTGDNTDLDATLNLSASGTFAVVAGETFTYSGSNNQAINFVSGGTIGGTGTFLNTVDNFNVTGATIAGGVTFENEGSLIINNGNYIIATTNFDNTGGVIYLNASDFNAPTLTVNGNITNAGSISVHLDAMQAGQDALFTTDTDATLTNSGTISVFASSGNPGVFEFDVNLTNTGLLSIIANATVLDGRIMDSRDGEIFMMSGGDHLPDNTLTFASGSTLIAGSDTVFSYDPDFEIPAGPGNIHFNSGALLSVAEEETLTIEESNVTLSFASGSEIGGAGTLAFAEDLDYTLSGVTLSVAAVNVDSQTLSLGGTMVVHSGSTISATSGTLASQLSIGSGVFIVGALILDSALGSTLGTVLEIAEGETLTILEGDLISRDSSGNSITQWIDGDLLNMGQISVESGTLSVSEGSTLNSSLADIDIATGSTLDIQGTLIVGNDTDLSGAGVLHLDEAGKLRVSNSESFTLGPQATSLEFTSGGAIDGTGTLVISGSENLTGAILSAGLNVDNNGTIVIQGGDLDINTSAFDNADGTLSFYSAHANRGGPQNPDRMLSWS